MCACTNLREEATTTQKENLKTISVELELFVLCMGTALMTETVPHAVAHSGSYTIAIATRVQ